MIDMVYKCGKCGRKFKVRRSTAMNPDTLWKNLCKIKDTVIKTHYDKYHKSDSFITVFPQVEGLSVEGHAKMLKIHGKFQISILCGLVFGRRNDGSMYFID